MATGLTSLMRNICFQEKNKLVAKECYGRPNIMRNIKKEAILRDNLRKVLNPT